jgi:hypothetical protein
MSTLRLDAWGTKPEYLRRLNRNRQRKKFSRDFDGVSEVTDAHAVNIGADPEGQCLGMCGISARTPGRIA